MPPLLGHRLPLATLLVLVLAGCASPTAQQQPAGTITPAPATRAVDEPTQAFVRAQAERGTRAEAQGQWAEAALAWEVLNLLQPDDPVWRDRLVAARQRIGTLTAERQATAEAAQRRGDLDLAAQAWLELLALDPGRRQAADALRQIERERIRRSYAGRFARLTLARRGPEADMATGNGSSEPARNANAQREHATLLVRQGDLDGAIQMLRESPLLRTDGAHKALLADLYVQKAEGLKQQQPEAARAAVEAALALDRRHAAALALQQQLPRVTRRAAPAPAPAAAAASRPR